VAKAGDDAVSETANEATPHGDTAPSVGGDIAQPTHEAGDRVTIDLQDALEEKASAQQDIKQQAERLKQELQSARENLQALPDDDDEVSTLRARIQDIRVEVQECAERYETLEHEREQIAAKIDQWGGAEFTLKKFGSGETTRVNNLLLEELSRDQLDDAAARAESMKSYSVQVGVVSCPPNTPGDVAPWPTVIRDWVYERLNNLNRYGDTDLTDFSLWEEIGAPDFVQNSSTGE
jgi:flagellar motility protein MotE (MotC chaperone)